MPRGNRNLQLDRTPWPQARTERLRRLFAEGSTDEKIAEALGVTQRAVIGKRLRLGLRRLPEYSNDPDDPLAMALRRQARIPKREE